MIRVLITSFNSSQYISRTLASIASQTVKDWKVYITDDISIDGSREYIKTLISGNSKFELIENEKKFWQTGNYWQVCQRGEIDDDDIAVTVDGDDWLPNETVFERILQYYAGGKTLLTFGQFVYYDGKNYTQGFTHKPDDFNNFRQLPWTSSHLRTFKVKVFRQINYKDVIDPETNWFFTNAGDVVLFSPMMEIAGENQIKWVDDINYVYNIETDLNEHKTSLNKTNRIVNMLKTYPKYSRIEF